MTLPVRPISLDATAVAIVPLLAALHTVAAQAQERPQAPFDIDRAYLVEPSPFKPFYVTGTLPLSEALEQRTVHDETPLLVVEHRAGRLALATEQMAYHHVAQGDFAGEPWLVSF